MDGRRPDSGVGDGGDPYYSGYSEPPPSARTSHDYNHGAGED